MKKYLISIMTFIFILSIVLNIYAASGSISVSSSSDTVVKGSTFTVTLSGAADTPIDGMYTKINYDKNVLKLESSMPGENYGNNSSEGEILITSNADTSPNSTTLYTITFKVLDTANVDSTKITFSESELHLFEENTTKKFGTNIDDVIIKIKEDDTTVGADGEEEQQPSDSEEPTVPEGTKTPSKDEGNKDTNSDKSNNGNKSNKKNNNKLPQTGVETASLITIVALSAVSIVSYVSYKKYKNI